MTLKIEPLTRDEEYLIYELRLKMLHTGYQPAYVVDNKTLEAVEKYIINDLLKKGLDPIIRCGKYGPYFKGCELVLEVK